MLQEVSVLNSLNLQEQAKSKLLQNEVSNLVFENQVTNQVAQEEVNMQNNFGGIGSSAMRALDLPIEFTQELENECQYKVYKID